MTDNFPHRYLAIARDESKKSQLEIKVGACLVAGKSIIRGHNKDKTHPEYANPQKHVRKSLHAELDCLIKSNTVVSGGIMHTYREVNGHPAMSRPCEHCIEFLRGKGIRQINYTVSNFPYWCSELI